MTFIKKLSCMFLLSTVVCNQHVYTSNNTNKSSWSSIFRSCCCCFSKEDTAENMDSGRVPSSSDNRSSVSSDGKVYKTPVTYEIPTIVDKKAASSLNPIKQTTHPLSPITQEAPPPSPVDVISFTLISRICINSTTNSPLDGNSQQFSRSFDDVSNNGYTPNNDLELKPDENYNSSKKILSIPSIVAPPSFRNILRSSNESGFTNINTHNLPHQTGN